MLFFLNPFLSAIVSLKDIRDGVSLFGDLWVNQPDKFLIVSIMKNNSELFYFLLSPVLGIIKAFENLQSSQARKVIFLFCLCFGFCFSVGTQRIEGSADGISMRMEFELYKGMSDVEYGNYISDYFDFDTGAQDIYIVTVSYLVGKLTDNYHFFFLIYISICLSCFFKNLCSFSLFYDVRYS